MPISKITHPFYGEVSGFATDSKIFGHIKTGALWEPHILEAIESQILPNSSCIVAGAYIGLHSMAVRIIENTVHVHSFEANPYIYPLLLQNLGGDSSATPYQIGLGEKYSKLFARSVKDNNNPGGARLFDSQLNFSTAEPDIHVDVRPIDHYKIPNVSLMKISVEGMEMEVISGAKRLIKQQRPMILTKIWDLDRPKLRSRKIRRIESMGYKFKMISPFDFLFTPK